MQTAAVAEHRDVFQEVPWPALQQHRGGLTELLGQAEANEISYLAFADILVEHEQYRRNRKRIDLNLRKAGFPVIKRLAEFDYRHHATITKRQINQLLDFRFLDERGNLVFILYCWRKRSIPTSRSITSDTGAQSLRASSVSASILRAKSRAFVFVENVRTIGRRPFRRTIAWKFPEVSLRKVAIFVAPCPRFLPQCFESVLWQLVDGALPTHPQPQLLVLPAFKMEAGPGVEPRSTDLQSAA